MPFSSRSPRSSKCQPGACHQIRTVLDTRTSGGPASEAILEPITTVTPATLPSAISHSPVCTPTRTSMPNERTPSTIAFAHLAPVAARPPTG